MTQRIPQSTSFLCVFKAFLASDHVTEATGKTIAITISKNGGAFGNPNAGATNATEISSGWYKVSLDSTDTGTIGPLALRGAAATIDDVGVLLEVVKATNGGYTALPDTAVTTNASLLTAGTGTSQLSVASGQVILQTGTGTGQLDFTSGVVKANATQFAGQTITAAAGVTLPASVASPTNITAGTITTVTNLTNAPTSGDLTATMKTSVTTAATAATPTAAAVTGSVGSVTGNVGGNVVGTVASVVGAVGSVTGSVGSVTGLTASNLDATVSSRLASASYTAPPTVNQNADGLLDRVDAVETGLTPRGLWRLLGAVLAGKIADAGTTTNTFRNAVADSKARLTATVDISGNRTAIVTDIT